MYIRKETLDDLLRAVLSKLVKSRTRIRPTKGSATELTGVLLKITNPRARLSRTEMKGTLFSCLGELLWYLGKSNDLGFISYYLKTYGRFSDDGKTLHGAYGPRLFSWKGQNQVGNVIARLKKNRYSRQAVIQLFDAFDIVKKHEDVPCTCTMQFMIRRGRLHMFVFMRSNDAFIGLPHDVFSFTMLQEIIARTLEIKLGTYNHAVGSLHLYKANRNSAHQYLEEGWQPTTPMPPMPLADPWKAIRKVVNAERAIRSNRKIKIEKLGLNSYWSDLVRLLQIYWHFNRNESNQISKLKRKMSFRLYDPYIEDKRRTADRKASRIH